MGVLIVCGLPFYRKRMEGQFLFGNIEYRTRNFEFRSLTNNRDYWNSIIIVKLGHSLFLDRYSIFSYVRKLFILNYPIFPTKLIFVVKFIYQKQL